jgi:diguanylate cyclase (GGDEF)-like protein
MDAATRPSAAPALVRAVIAAGIIALAAVAQEGLPDLDARTWAAVAALAGATVLAGLFPIRLEQAAGSITTAPTFAFALVLVAGPLPAALAQAAACVVTGARHRRPARRVAFDAAQHVLALCAAGSIVLATTDLGSPVRVDPGDLPGLLLAAALVCAVNTVFVGLYERRPLARLAGTARRNGAEATLLGIAPLVVLTLEHAPVLGPLAVLPLLALHRSGRHALARERIAAHDALTGLPNRTLFADRTERAIAEAREAGTFLAVMLLDLDRFKAINDTLGHAAGDRVLREMAGRLEATIAPGDLVARLGGDEFTVLVRSAPGPHEAAMLGERLRSAVLPPVLLDGVPVSLDVSIGVAFHPEHGTDTEALVQRADVAMYDAKAAGGGVRCYAAERDAHSVARLAMTEELRAAVRDGDIQVHFQPQVDLQTGAVVGVEALARWQNHALGPIPPAEFIPVAEESGAILELTDHVLEQAIGHAGDWRRAGLELAVAVNLSGRVLTDRALPTRVRELCSAHGLPPELLVLEVTESMVLSDPVVAGRTLERLAALGVTVSIDDFGTGFSSLEHLKTLPVAEVKIDRGFVLGLDGEDRDRAIVEGTMHLAHALGMRVVAEGVEHERALAELRAMGCELGQGYHWSPPVPAGDVPATVARLSGARRRVPA